MIIKKRKYAGYNVEEVLLKDPEYVRWFLQQYPTSSLELSVQKEMRRLIENFNTTPFIKKCMGRSCNRNATRVSLIPNSTSLYFWCDRCEPRHASTLYPISIVRTYEDMLDILLKDHAAKSRYRIMIAEMAKAKGLSETPTKKNLEKFFSLPV